MAWSEYAALGGVGVLPELAHHGAAAQPLSGVPEEQEGAVAGLADAVVGRLAGVPDRAVGEVLVVVVDRVVDLVLHPGRRALHEPDVLVDVVGELDRVEVLVGGSDPECVDRRDAELRPRVVVVEHAVRRRAPVAGVGLVAVRGAVAVVAVPAEVTEEHVELAVRVVARGHRGGIGDGNAVAERPRLEGADVLERVERRRDLRLGRRLRQRRLAVVHAEVSAAPSGRCGHRDGVDGAVGVDPIAGEHLVGRPAVLAAELRPRQVEIAQGHRDLGVDSVAHRLARTLGLPAQLAFGLGEDILRLCLGEGRLVGGWQHPGCGRRTSRADQGRERENKGDEGRGGPERGAIHPVECTAWAGRWHPWIGFTGHDNFVDDPGHGG